MCRLEGKVENMEETVERSTMYICKIRVRTHRVEAVQPTTMNVFKTVEGGHCENHFRRMDD